MFVIQTIPTETSIGGSSGGGLFEVTPNTDTQVLSTTLRTKAEVLSTTLGIGSPDRWSDCLATIPLYLPLFLTFI